MKLGENLDTDGFVQVSQEDLCSGVYIIGRAGRGKSALLEYAIYQQINNERSVIVLDGHGDLIEKVIAGMSKNRIKDKTYLLDLTERDWPFSLNIFACDNVEDEIQRDATRNQVMHAFDKLFPGTEEQQYFGDVLEAVIVTLIYNPTLTLAHVPRLLAEASFRKPYVEKVRDFATCAYWDEYTRLPAGKQHEQTVALLRRLRKKIFTESVVTNMICQPQANINFRKFIDEQKILLVKLPTEVEAYRKSASVVGTLILAMIYAAVFSYADTDERPGVSIFADEFQHFATDEQVKLFTGARKYKAKTFLAHQYQKQLDEVGLPESSKDGLLSANTIIAFSTTPEDSRTVARGFTGLKRKQTIIYPNPLDRPDFQKHRSASVRDFYVRYIIPLETAAKMRITTENGKEVLPRSNLGFGQVVSFRPDAMQILLRQLNDLLYYTQVAGAIDESELHTLVYETCVSAIGSLPFDMVPDWENREKRKTLQKEIFAHQVRIAVDDTIIEGKSKQMASLEEEIRQVAWEAQKNYRDWWGTHPPLGNDIEHKYHLDRVFSSYDLAFCPDRTIWFVDGIEGKTMKFRGKNFTRQYNEIQQAREAIEAAQKDKEILEKEKQNLERKLNALPTEKKAERTDILERFAETVRRVLETLIVEPIAADKAELATTEIADLLLGLEKRHAYVKVGSQVFRMKTLDLEREKNPPHPDVVKKYREIIVAQTRQAFCRPRAEVERAIRAVLAPETPTQPPDEDEPPTDNTWKPYEEL